MSRWKTIPVFISSTFRDMHAERDKLNNTVFPALEERLRERRCRLEPIDLRVGVKTDTADSEQEREERILKVCLNEIDRSRPFLLVMLGDRYGWVPGEERIRTATQQAGLTTSAAGRSVTSLEIEYGLLEKDSEQRSRSILLMRRPMPYSEMGEEAAIYSEAHSTAAGAAQRAKQLDELKEKLAADPVLEPHLLWYELGWDSKAKCPKGLDNRWAETVIDAIWRQLDAETQAFAQKAERSWQEQELFSLEEFTERLDRSFCGRDSLVNEVVTFALSSAGQDEQAWCVTAESGAGKSAFFSRVYRLLSKQKEPILLAEAGGISPRAGRLHWTLRRWTSELATAVGLVVDLPEDLSGQALEARFAEVLSHAASKRRVIVMADALNQFERTDRMLSLCWLPDPLPRNVRFLATAIPGEESERLGRRKGARTTELPVFTAAEVESVAKSIFARYHREPAEGVIPLLAGVLRPDGQPAAGNALWLTMAVELLNLLDADDFAEAESYGERESEEKLRRLVLNRCRDLPPSIGPLYGLFLRQAEKAAGKVETRAFSALIALSRHGLAEKDLEQLLAPAAAVLFPAQPPVKWDALRFATFRRFLRAQLVARGESLHWDFAHATLRASILEQVRNPWRPTSADPLPLLHSVIADYLEKSRGAGPTRAEERMWQVLGTLDAHRFARYYLLPETGSAALAEYLIEESHQSEHPLLEFALGTISDAGVQSATQAGIGNKFIFDLVPALDERNGAALLASVLNSAESLLAKLHAGHPESDEYARALSVCHERQGDLQAALGEGDKAFDSYSKALQLREELHDKNPESAGFARDLSIVYNRLGDLQRSSANREKALELYRKGLEIGKELCRRDPQSIPFNRDLSVSYERLGDLYLSMGQSELALNYFQRGLEIAQELHRRSAHADSARDLATSYERLGDIQIERGMAGQAIESHRKALDIRDNLRIASPLSSTAAQEAFASYERLSELAQRQGDDSQAMEFCRKQLEIAEELIRRNPQSAAYTRDQAVCYRRMGDLHRIRGESEAALVCYRISLEKAEELRLRDPRSADCTRNVAAAHECIGDLQLAIGHGDRALEHHSRAFELRVYLHEQDAGSSDLACDLSLSYERIGDIHLRRGHSEEALDFYSKALHLREEMRQKDQESADLARAIFVICERMGDLQMALGNRKQALAVYQRQLAIAKEIYRRNPQFTESVRDLSISHERIGNLYLELGKLDLALGSFSEAYTFRQRLYRRNAESRECARDLSASYECMGDLNKTMGRRELALELYSKALELREELVRRSPDMAEDLSMLSATVERIGDTHRDLGEGEKALPYFQKALDIGLSMTCRDPESADCLRQLAIAYQRIGECQMSMGLTSEALESYGKDLAIAQDLHLRNPKSAELFRELSVSYGRMGDLYSSLGGKEKARECFSKALSISEDLRACNSEAPEFARHLGVDYERMGDYHRGMGEMKQAGEFYRKAVALRHQLCQQNPQSADCARDLWISCWRMADMSERVGSMDAKEWWRKTHALLTESKDRGILLPGDECYLEAVQRKLG
jgi:tetratricopeptide (TPR) repeat protein